MNGTLRLRAGEARALLAFAGDLAECREPDQLHEQVAAIPAVAGADSVILSGSRDWGRELFVEVGDERVYSGEMLGVVARSWREHPIILSDLANAAAGVRRISDLVRPADWQRRILFNDFYRPLGMTRELALQVAWGPAGSSCCLAVHRSGRDFSERDRAVLAILAPHLRAARARVMGRELVSPEQPNGSPWEPGARTAKRLSEALGITPREGEVLERLAAGRTNDGIALDLEISRHTVVRHVERIYRKLDVHTRAGATRVALEALRRT